MKPRTDVASGSGDSVRRGSADVPTWMVHAGSGESLLFRMFRYFSLISFVFIALAAVSLALLFRINAVREVTAFGEQNNELLAQVTLNFVRPATTAFLKQYLDLKKEDIQSIALPSELKRALEVLTAAKAVVRVNIYNQRGWIIYSSAPHLVGLDESADEHVQTALAGHLTSDLHYRDMFTLFDRTDESPSDLAVDKVMEAYVPITLDTDQVLGIFEIYVDVSSLVADIEQAQWRVIGTSIGIMGLLYLVLLGVVRLARNVIERQQNQIFDHAMTLELLSGRMLQHQEDEKRRIAFDLHEGIAQTLSAVKMGLKAVVVQLSARGSASVSALEPMLALINDAIAEVRNFALSLRPPSLDDLGLTATIQWFCREYEQLHPGFQVDLKMRLADAQIPERLRNVIFRVIEEVCIEIATRPGVSRIEIVLELEEAQIVLRLEHDRSWPSAGTASAGLTKATERVVLTGGQFVLAGNPQGGSTVRVVWPV